MNTPTETEILQALILALEAKLEDCRCAMWSSLDDMDRFNQAWGSSFDLLLFAYCSAFLKNETDVRECDSRFLIVPRAIEVMKGYAAGMQWLRSPQYGLGGEVPWKYAHGKAATQEVLDLLGRIEYGVYS